MNRSAEPAPATEGGPEDQNASAKSLRLLFVLVVLASAYVAVLTNSIREGMAVRTYDATTDQRRHAYPSLLTRFTPGASLFFSRTARGTWNVSGPADRINLPNGRRYYLSNFPADAPQASVNGFVPTSTPIWPDARWYVQRGEWPVEVVAETRDGHRWVYGLSGGW